MRKLIILFFFLILNTPLFSQDLRIGASAGYSTFFMNELYGNLNSGKEQLPFDAQITSSYPGWISFGGFFEVRATRLSYLGLKYEFNSTGARISRKDYSGEFRYDELLRSHFFCLTESIEVFRSGNILADIQLNPGMIYSNIKTIEDITVSDTTIFSNSQSYHSLSFAGEIRLRFNYSFDSYDAGAYIGYLYDFGGRLKNTNGTSSIKTQWTGLRVGVIFSYSFFRKKQKEKD